MLSIPDRYRITAELSGDIRSETRCRAASAMVLADRWAQEGCRNIRLTDRTGIARSREHFRATLLPRRQPAFS